MRQLFSLCMHVLSDKKEGKPHRFTIILIYLHFPFFSSFVRSFCPELNDIDFLITYKEKNRYMGINFLSFIYF